MPRKHEGIRQRTTSSDDHSYSGGAGFFPGAFLRLAGDFFSLSFSGPGQNLCKGMKFLQCLLLHSHWPPFRLLLPLLLELHHILDQGRCRCGHVPQQLPALHGWISILILLSRSSLIFTLISRTTTELLQGTMQNGSVTRLSSLPTAL
jgi:hypothetical protein